MHFFLLASLALLALLFSHAHAAAVPKPSGACNFACPASDRTSHVLVNTVRNGIMLECWYGGNGVCTYNLNAGKIKKGKSTSNDCRPHAIASCKRRSTKTKDGKKKSAPAQAQAQVQAAPLLMQRAPIAEVQDTTGSSHREHEDM